MWAQSEDCVFYSMGFLLKTLLHRPNRDTIWQTTASMKIFQFWMLSSVIVLSRRNKYNLYQYGTWVSKFHITQRCYDSFLHSVHLSRYYLFWLFSNKVQMCSSSLSLSMQQPHQAVVQRADKPMVVFTRERKILYTEDKESLDRCG